MAVPAANLASVRFVPAVRGPIPSLEVGVTWSVLAVVGVCAAGERVGDKDGRE